jgi:hypothetical protein
VCSVWISTWSSETRAATSLRSSSRNSSPPTPCPTTIKEAVLAKIKAEKKAAGQDEKTDGDNRTLELYTWVKRGEKSNWTVCQEVKGIKLPDTDGTYPLDKCPWLPLRWTRIDGENYGRGHCEEYIGDLASLESLSKFSCRPVPSPARYSSW